MLALQAEILRTFKRPIPLGIVADWVEERAFGVNAQLLMYWLRRGEMPPALSGGGGGGGGGSCQLIR